MPHTYLALDVSLIPESIKQELPTYQNGRFSNDLSKRIFVGYSIDSEGNYILHNGNKKIAHTQEFLNYCLNPSDNPSDTFDLLHSTSIEYTREQLKAKFEDETTIWYRVETS